MKLFRHILITGLAGLFTSLPLARADESVGEKISLPQLFEKSAEQVLSIRVSRLQADAARLSRERARGSLFPQVQLQSRSQWLDAVQLGGPTAPFSQSFQQNTLINFSQSIFKGGSAYFANRALGTEIDISEARKEQTLLDLYGEVAILFYDILLAEREVVNLEQEKRLLDDRLKELNNWVSVGRSRRSELLQARSQRERIEADLMAKRAEYQGQLKSLVYYTGPGDFVPYEAPRRPTRRFENWEQELLNHVQLRERELEMKRAKESYRATHGALLPSVDFAGNYFLDRAGILSDSKWDLSLTASWLLFGGGQNWNASKLEHVALKIAENEWADLQRRLRIDFESQYEIYLTQAETLDKRAQAVDLAEQSYRETEKDYRRGWVNFLELNSSRQQRLESKNAYDQAYIELQKREKELSVRLGKIPQ